MSILFCDAFSLSQIQHLHDLGPNALLCFFKRIGLDPEMAERISVELAEFYRCPTDLLGDLGVRELPPRPLYEIVDGEPAPVRRVGT